MKMGIRQEAASNIKKLTGITYPLWAILFALSFRVSAQQPTKIPRIGFLVASTADAQLNRTDAFRRGLRELGYVEGQNVIIEYRYADGNSHRLSELAAELVRLKLDVIVTQNNTLARAASRATKTIPIVMADGADPVTNGLVASLACPGGNVTGMTNAATDLGVKRLELLKEIFPTLARVAVLPSPRSARVSKEVQAAAPSLQIQLHIMEVRVAEDLERAFETAANARVGALTLTVGSDGPF